MDINTLNYINAFGVIAQAVILLITAGILIWYTIETAKIRKETQRQNILLSEQIEQTKNINGIQDKNERLLSKPRLKIGGGSYDLIKKSATFEIYNIGADITIEDLLEIDGNAKLNRKGYWMNKERRQIDLNWANSKIFNSIEFEISYKDRLSRAEKLVYLFTINNAGHIDLNEKEFVR
ncbi:hypothetical protein [Leptospira saintgironsiae]|uniref:Uncharacterized protein n=1 Tax=Leptospira saintgironsiae TaxID=2023183 RepID=A0A2M9Y7X7_9LEPT|nr:hypothetical protein [Leptospira saintgironsiae]PJZ47553.1 hypothetical protein CH362_18605 [Leptospira saintgironsiae]